MNYLFKSLIFVGLLITCNNLSAQPFSGLVVECVNCEQYHARTEPRNGLWYNPGQSGVGYSIEVQNGKVFGVYYGYDEVEKPTWLTFVADLVPSDNPDIMWTLDADLLQFEGGNCINCDYQAPNTTSFESTIHIDFKQKNYASFSINEGDSQNIVPIVYGVSASEDFPEQTSYRFPDLTGLWTFVVNNVRTGYPAHLTTYSEILEIGSKYYYDRDQDGSIDVNYGVISFSHGDNLMLGDIVCGKVLYEKETTGLECRFYDNRLIIDPFNQPPPYKLSIGGLGAFRIFGEKPTGETFEAIRINYGRD